MQKKTYKKGVITKIHGRYWTHAAAGFDVILENWPLEVF
jgi:hypothetical protein